MGERIDVEGDTYGLRPDQGTPIPNKADAAWERLQKLRAELRELGVEVDDRDSLAELEELIARRNTRRP